MRIQKNVIVLWSTTGGDVKTPVIVLNEVINKVGGFVMSVNYDQLTQICICIFFLTNSNTNSNTVTVSGNTSKHSRG